MSAFTRQLLGIGEPDAEGALPPGLIAHIDQQRFRIIHARGSTTASNNPRSVHATNGIDFSPDGICVDTDGNLWVAHVGDLRVAKLNPTGELIDEVPVPAKMVTSVAFGGSDHADLYIVTADNLEDPAKGGSIYRDRPGITGAPTPLVRV